MRRVVGAVVALLVPAALSGCSGLSGTDDVNYRTDGAGIVQIDPDDRAGPVDIAGTTLDGDELDLADLQTKLTGRQVVLSGVEASLTQAAASALNQAFGTTALKEGLPLGVAAVHGRIG